MAKRNDRAAGGDEAVASAPAEPEPTETVELVEDAPQEAPAQPAAEASAEPAAEPAAAPVSPGPIAYAVTLTDRVRPHKIEVPIIIDGRAFTFRRALEAAKGRPAVTVVSTQTIRLSTAQARQLSREGWDVTPVEK